MNASRDREQAILEFAEEAAKTFSALNEALYELYRRVRDLEERISDLERLFEKNE